MGWTHEDSEDTYGISAWGRDLFSVNEAGHLQVKPDGPGTGAIDLSDLVEELSDRDIQLPILVRFPGVVRQRLRHMARCFSEAASMFGFKGRYRGVYPIKVNQSRHLVEELVGFAGEHAFGLEAGSKPELIVAAALLDDPNALLICNGYKDRDYVHAALASRLLGRDTVLVIEKASEVTTILKVAEELGVEPVLGVRAKLSTPGKGRWSGSSGDKAKFGLSAADLIYVVDTLRAAGKLDCLKLLHFHIGSQVPNIRAFKVALREATRIYTELARLGAPMAIFDVGGGLAVDYDGSQSDWSASSNYNELEYAADVVAAITEACDGNGLAHPDIVTESGRATVAHSSILLFDIVGTHRRPLVGPLPEPTDEDPAELQEFFDLHRDLNRRNYRRCWHDARDARERAVQSFALGMHGLDALARTEELFWRLAGRVQRIVEDEAYVAPEFESMESLLADTYYGNFSVFQSIPDSWAIQQLFPIAPIQRLHEEPTRRAVLGDLTCDSDGKVDRFVSQRDVRRVLELHEVREGERYVLAIALVGAYQEILGDMHNLFGDTNAVHVDVAPRGFKISRVVEGDTVEDVVNYVQYDRKDLVHRLRNAAERAIEDGLVERRQAGRVLSFFRNALDQYTYLAQDTERMQSAREPNG